ncbi:MAG: kinase/pyrophosphorylase [Gammaproteobacteria bacterium]|nr:kinase/pyrophosphorylase [Gammaproteobacteria bacterium]
MRTVFFVSDSTGITAETLGNALLAQFEGIQYRAVTLPFINELRHAKEARETIDAAFSEEAERPLVFSTLTNPEALEAVSRSNALVLDLFSVFLRPLETELNRGSTHAMGRFHGMVDRENYEIRIEAMDFALNHDDGVGTHHYEHSDIILVGVSRSGKTPTCVYLAMQFGLRAANYPLTPEDLAHGGLPRVLRGHESRIYGLTIEPERLQQIRQARRPDSSYSSLAQCHREVRVVNEMFRQHHIPVLDTTNMSIEEISSRILRDTGLKRRFY